QLQINATNSLMALNQQFEKEQQSITSILHQDLESKKLESQWQKLESKYHLWISVIGVILVLIAAYLFWKNKRTQIHKSTPSHQKNVIYQSETTDTETIEISRSEEHT